MQLEASTLTLRDCSNIDGKSDLGVTPRRLLRDHPEELRSLKRKRSVASSPDCVCPGAACRSRLAWWEIEEGDDEHSSMWAKPLYWLKMIPRSFVNAPVDVTSACGGRGESLQGPSTLPCKSALVQRLREPEVVGELVNVPLKASQAGMEGIERLASGLDLDLSSLTLAAVCKETKTIAGYVHATFDSTQNNLEINHCKVDHAHHGKGLAGLLLEADVGIDKGITRFTVKLVVLDTNAAAGKCCEMAGLKEYGRGDCAFPPTACPQNIEWLRMSKTVTSFRVWKPPATL